MTKRSEVVVGAVLVACLALVAGGTLWLKGAGWGREEMVVRARFREIGQLQRGNAVKLRGVPIGEVAEIALEPTGDGVIVGLRVQRDAPLPADPVVVIAPESMFGDWQAEIFPRSRFPRYAYAESPDPQVLPGYSLPDISRLTAVADEIAQNLAVLTDRVELAFTEETALNVRRAIENIQQVSEQLTATIGSQQRAIDEVAGNLAEATEALGEAAVATRRVLAQVEGSVGDGELAAIVDNVHRTTAQIDSLSGLLLAAGSRFDATMVVADSAFRSVGEITTRVQQGEGSLGRLLADTVLYTDLVRTNVLLQDLIRDIKANPRRYLKFGIF